MLMSVGPNCPTVPGCNASNLDDVLLYDAAVTGEHSAHAEVKASVEALPASAIKIGEKATVLFTIARQNCRVDALNIVPPWFYCQDFRKNFSFATTYLSRSWHIRRSTSRRRA